MELLDKYRESNYELIKEQAYNSELRDRIIKRIREIVLKQYSDTEFIRGKYTHKIFDVKIYYYGGEVDIELVFHAISKLPKHKKERLEGVLKTWNTEKWLDSNYSFKEENQYWGKLRYELTVEDSLSGNMNLNID